MVDRGIVGTLPLDASSMEEITVPIITVTDLCKQYQTYRKPEGLGAAIRGLVRREAVIVPAVSHVSFRVEPGEMVAFLGPNGAGKTTTLKMLSGLLHPTSGAISVADHVPFRRAPALLRQIALVAGQKSQLWPDLPPMDSFALNREIYDVPDAQFRATLRDLVDLLDLADVLQMQVRRLSLGQRMRCELAAALLHRPRILFLDEPTLGLDVVVQRRVRDFLRDHNARYGTTVLLTSHDMDDVEAVCPRVLVINGGQLVFDGAMAALIARMATRKYLTVVFDRPVAIAELAAFGTVVWSDNNLSVTLAVPRANHARHAAALLNQYPVAELDIRDPDLDEIIARVYADGAGGVDGAGSIDGVDGAVAALPKGG